MKRFVFALLWLCSCVAISNAANVYVTTTGVDAQDGLSWATAKSSIQAAVDVTHLKQDQFVKIWLKFHKKNQQ